MDEKFMVMAIAKTREGILLGQTPFGACVVKDGAAVAVEHNRVWRDTDITAHAEITAIRAACKALNTVDLAGAVIYSTTEPCPMCFAAIHWANIDKIIYGAGIADAKAAGFNELTVSNRELKDRGGSRVEVVSGCLEEECRGLFKEWMERGAGKAY